MAIVTEPNFSAEIHFTVGLKRSAAITDITEGWLRSVEDCDVVENDLIDEGAVTVLECVGVDLDAHGSFVVKVLGVAKFDESPDYEIIEIKMVGSK